MKKPLLQLPFLFGVGGSIYYCMELLWRGYSHWSMFVLSGICFIIIDHLNRAWKKGHSRVLLMALCSLIITFLEFITGLIVNTWLGLGVWDYSNHAFNLMGQICLLFSILWFFVSYAAIIVDNFLYRFVFQETFSHISSIQK